MGRQNDKPMSAKQIERAYHDLVVENARLKHQLANDQDHLDHAMADASTMAEGKDGYARHGVAPDGNHWYRWKWTQGKHAGRYVIGGGQTLQTAIVACYNEYSRTLRGLREALLDVGYRNRNT